MLEGTRKVGRLMRWFDNVGRSSVTTRRVMLGGKWLSSDRTELGDLRKFVASLEKWPDSADVRPTSGAILEVSFDEYPDSLIVKVD